VVSDRILGIIFVVLIVLLLFLSAVSVKADTSYAWTWWDGTVSAITLQATDAPGAVAEVVFDNRTVHQDEDVRFPLVLDGLAIKVIAIVGRGVTPDRIEVIPPDGYLADPAVLDVPENEVGRVLIFEWVGM